MKGRYSIRLVNKDYCVKYSNNLDSLIDYFIKHDGIYGVFYMCIYDHFTKTIVQCKGNVYRVDTLYSIYRYNQLEGIHSISTFTFPHIDSEYLVYDNYGNKYNPSTSKFENNNPESECEIPPWYISEEKFKRIDECFNDTILEEYIKYKRMWDNIKDILHDEIDPNDPKICCETVSEKMGCAKVLIKMLELENEVLKNE